MTKMEGVQGRNLLEIGFDTGSTWLFSEFVVQQGLLIFFLFLVKESGGVDSRCMEDDQDERRGISIVLGCCINNMAYYQEGIPIVLMMGLL